jgi:glycosyltransferase involved in cell wall biosynthesis
MRIAQVAPLAEAVPPKLYGGTERVVSWLTEELVHRGHEVTLFASGDSITGATLVPACAQALRLAGIRDHLASHIVLMRDVRRLAEDFDIIHFHVDLVQYAMFEDLAHKTLTTMHGRLDVPDFMPVYQAFPEMPLISISDHQRLPMPPDVNWLGTIPHGLPKNLVPFDAKGGEYLAFLGRISPEKRPDRAIEIAKRAGIPLRIAAKVDRVDQGYFDQVIAPLLDDPLIEFIGEITQDQKPEFLGKAKALLFPIDWPEPFGLVMIEAMSAGTPVIAWRNGSVPEIIKDGVSGFIVDSMDEAVAATSKLDELSRRDVRNHFLSSFTAERMARDYESAYMRLVGEQRVENGAKSSILLPVTPSFTLDAP